MRNRYINIIVDLQFGSCGKGLFAGYLARKLAVDTVVTAWAPNAGHTFMEDDGTKYVHTMVPCGVHAPSVKRVLIGPGSVLNVQSLLDELHNLRWQMEGVEVMIHPHAAIVTARHREEEAGYGYKIGSTMKGAGAALIQKIRRDRADMNIAAECEAIRNYVCRPDEYDEAVDASDQLLVEGAQGYSLGINSGFYPYTTSRECTTAQIISDCGLPMVDMEADVYGVCRTFPIRVANRKDADGNEIGWSGPCYPDQREIQWQELGIEPELTTVTKLPRRVFTFSEEQIARACRMNGVDWVFLNFCNYMMKKWELDEMVGRIEQHAPVRWTGWGPKVTDIKEVK
jgi:adenylosuccinate synthase